MDGIHIRPIAPGDRDALAASFERLSPESRYLRFFSPVSRLSGQQLRYLTEVDHHDHEALVAIEEDGGTIVGVARYVRTDGDDAEPAVVVIDEWQHRGIGSLLLDRLADRAREEGITCFVAEVLAHNDAALAALSHLGETRVLHQGLHVEVQIDLERADAAAPTLRDLLRRAAEQSIRPAVSILQRLAVSAERPGGPPANVIVVGEDAALATARRLAAALGAEVEVVEPGRGGVAASLLDAALEQRARLIVVDGLGTAWDHVSHHPPCDVLVVR